MIRLALLVVAAALALPAAAEEGLDRRDFTCPVGGERFTQDVGYSAFPLIVLPDGSWLGDALIDVQIPACPKNGLVLLPDYAAMEKAGDAAMLYGDYSAAELAQLPGLIADPAYAALARDNRHAQAYWLATRLGRPATLRFHLLQRSTWATIDPRLRRRRVAAFAADAPALIDAMDLPEEEQHRHRLYVVNALRELGRFDEAIALLQKLEDAGLPGGDAAAPGEMFGAFPGERMRRALAARDDDRYPVDLLDDRMAGETCSGEPAFPPYDQRTAKTRAACARRQAAIDATEAAMEEAAALDAEPARRDLLCAATAPDKRSAGLAQSCGAAQERRDEAAGNALAVNARTLAPQCDTTAGQQREGPLFYACLTYEGAVSTQLAQMLVADDAAFDRLCAHAVMDPDRPEPEAVHDSTAFACQSAIFERREAAIAALEADPAALDTHCAATPADRRDLELSLACDRRQKAADTAVIEQLVRDDAAYQRRCARFGDRPRDLFAENPDADELLCDQARYRRAGGFEAQDPFAAGDAIVLDVDEQLRPEDAASAAGAGAGPDAATRALRDAQLDEDSDLNRTARDAARAIIAKAKAPTS